MGLPKITSVRLHGDPMSLPHCAALNLLTAAQVQKINTWLGSQGLSGLLMGSLGSSHLCDPGHILLSLFSDLLSLTGLVYYQISIQGSEHFQLEVYLQDEEGNIVARGTGGHGLLQVPNAHLWWPYLMHEHPAYLYSLEVMVVKTGAVGGLLPLPAKLTWL